MSTLALGLTTTFREKLEWLEEAETLILEMRAHQEKLLKRERKSAGRKR